ncbi:metallophosphoesterase [Brevibacillus humidisoli]|uniref:metallophosphoesterase family protein n=1 Tax=Brevibacillus humidisoli TaxID=2895522 RepID=UPI001E3B2DA3|nr:metallophosphoesterase [Brevibacillus humidisoli]UFJ42586.1 metallophosphoesterase [Brevibacillus humidisoli]
MIIGVVADTHIAKPDRKLPEPLVAGLYGVDLIVHAGDWTTMQVYEQLACLAPVVGVYGNADDEEVKQHFKQKEVLRLEGYEIGVVHGDGKGKTTRRRALDAFAGESLDLLIFGHSHIPLLEPHGEILLFNPGSPTDKRRQPLYTYGLVELSDSLQVRHCSYAAKS